MKLENKELLDKVMEDRLIRSLDYELSEEERKTSFDEAMMITDREVQVDHNNVDAIDKIGSQELKKKESKFNMWFAVCTFVGGAIIGSLFDVIRDEHFVDKVIRYEKTDTFTTTPGRTIQSRVFNKKSRKK